jgi:hypothetical protein
MSVIARWAAILTTCASRKDVTAWMIVAPPVARASGRSRSARPRPRTSSIRYFELAGRTSPESRFTSMRTNPMASDRRWVQMSARVSPHARDTLIFFFGGVVSAIVTRNGETES